MIVLATITLIVGIVGFVVATFARIGLAVIHYGENGK